MNIHRMFTTVKQSCFVYFVLSDLWFCKFTRFFNSIFAFDFFINQVMNIFTASSFAHVRNTK